VKGLNVAIVDCDYPQHSIIRQKKRDMEVVKTTPVYQNLLVEQAVEEEGLPGYRQYPGGLHDGLKGIRGKGRRTL
jgi:hypothetical protein